MKRMENDQLVKRIIESDVRGMCLREWPKTAWINGVKRVLNGRGMSVEQGSMIVRDRT